MSLSRQQWAEDWRNRGQESYLYGVHLFYKTYTPPFETWTHDHCEFCWATFSDDTPGDLHCGYVSEENNHWVCDECFEDLKKIFMWTVQR